MSKEDRDSCIESFRNRRVKVLIATNVLSRGFDVSSVSFLIINTQYKSLGDVSN